MAKLLNVPITLAMALLLTVAAYGGGSDEAPAETAPQFEEYRADPVQIPVELLAGQGVEVDVILQVSELERGFLAGSADLDGRFLLTYTTAYPAIEPQSEARFGWTCAAPPCRVTAQFRLDAFTDVAGTLTFSAAGSSDDLPAGATATIEVARPQPGPAATYELLHRAVPYPPGSTSPLFDLVHVEYDFGDPSDDIAVALRPQRGPVELEQPVGAVGPVAVDWATATLVSASETCVPDCRGRATVRMGPSDGVDLAFQILGYSSRPGVGQVPRLVERPVTVTEQFGMAVLTPDEPVVAIPISISRGGEGVWLAAAPGAARNQVEATLRAVETPSFEPPAAWINPPAGGGQYELAISSPDVQQGTVNVPWGVVLFELTPGLDPALEVGAQVATTFETGRFGDPHRFAAAAADTGGGAGILPWIVGAGAAVTLGGFGAYRYRRRK